MARHIALGLQYIYTNGACATFAAAAMGLQTCAGSRAVEVEHGDSDHMFLLLADGSALDAEGVRPVADLLRDFGMPGDVPLAAADIGDGGDHASALRAHLLEMGWGDALPVHDRRSCATTRFLAAERDFDRLGGWSGTPVDAIRAAGARVEV